MHLKNYYRWSFALPLVVPPAALGITRDARGWLGDVHFLLWGSLLVGGLPYLGFAGLSLWKLRDQSARRHGRFLLVAPIIFAALLAVLTVAWELLFDGQSRVSWLIRVATSFGGCGLLLGYTYTGLVHLMRVMLQGAGWVSRGEP
ncbi:MAG: hypothetical protein DHS20C15_20650 [Planctomycetota bacterium]|nr:MAG: hypothetical protein DHS20C15_20650 [Planctomycetota bacterium]